MLVVASPNELDPRSTLQIGHLLARYDDLAARDLRIVNLTSRQAGRMAGRTLSTRQVSDLRSRWQLPAGEWAVVLVGKDGGVKERWSSIVEPSEVFGKIDAMPMRLREMGDRRL